MTKMEPYVELRNPVERSNPPGIFARSLKNGLKALALAVIVAFLTGFFSMVYQVERLDRRVERLVKSNESLSSENLTLNTQNAALQARARQVTHINHLATEFSMDPSIVTLVDRYAHKFMNSAGTEWRLLRTPEFLTYIMLSLIHTESRGNPDAIGDGGKARGLTQIWVSTARQYGEVTAAELHQPETNISFAFQHFHHLLKRYRGNLALALYAWNRGSGTVDKLLTYGESPQNGFAKKVYEAALLNNRDLLRSESSFPGLSPSVSVKD
ncbi:MAG: lytic transglycosylase domain-containing protein [Acidobacteriota bacterium]